MIQTENNFGFASVLFIILVFVAISIVAILNHDLIARSIDSKFITRTDHGKTENRIQSTPGNPLAFTPLLKVKQKSFPIIVDDKLILLNISQPGQTSINTGIKVFGGGSSIYQGASDPLPSPDLTKIAYISDGKLGLITADGKSKIELPLNFKVSYLTAWSPDSKKLLISVPGQNLLTASEGMGGLADEIKFDKDSYAGGFYLVDTEIGKVTLTPLIGGMSFMDNNNILATLENYGSVGNTNYILFNTETFTANTKILRDSFKDYFYPQISFNQYGKKWAFSIGNTGNEANQVSSSKIIVANFPSLNGQILEQGTWAEYQFPMLSPTGKNVVYTNHIPPVDWNLIVWDGQSKRRIEGNNKFRIWVDDDRFIYSQSIGQTTINQKYYLYDLKTSQSTSID